MDICTLVASNPSQARAIRSLIAVRQNAGLYPREIEFVVLSDPEGGRVGSGGATLLALHSLRGHVESGKRVLVIHAGGESRRLPVYAPEGKLFAPVAVGTSSIIPPVILDLQLSLFLKYPWHPGEILIASGDVVIDFDTDVVPTDRGEVYGFAKAESLETGSEHGVFKFGRNRADVIGFYQKESVEFLRDNAALEGGRQCAVDLGIVGLSADGVKRFMALSDSKFGGGRSFKEELLCGNAGFDLYNEFFIACLKKIGLDDYLGRVKRHSTLDREHLEAVYASFEEVELRALLTRRGSFLHFGTLAEYPESSAALVSSDAAPFYSFGDAEIEPEVRQNAIVINSYRCEVTPAPGAETVFAERCSNAVIHRAPGGNVFSGLRDRRFLFEIPPGVCVDERTTTAGRILLVYHRDDTWKKSESPGDLRFCGTPLTKWLSDRALGSRDIEPGPDLYALRLFPVDVDDAFIRGYWDASVVDDTWRKRFRDSMRVSIAEVNAETSAEARDRERIELRTSQLRDELMSGRGWVSIPEWDFATAFPADRVAAVQNRFPDPDDDLIAMYRQKLAHDAAASDAGSRVPTIAEAARPSVQYLSRATSASTLHRGVKLDQIVWARSPVRLDLAGGWTDTPPYTLREGGEVVNVAVDLNGQPPIQVFCRPTEKRTISAQSIDVGVRELIDSFESIEDYTNPTSPFALPRAALCLLGLTQNQHPGQTLQQVLDHIGCGLELTLLSAVPKGSGLGTSSILAATILGALERFFGINVVAGELVRQVLQIEQMLTTGGGWQDQIGGIVGGVKYIVAAPGLHPDPLVYQLDPYLFGDPRVARHFTLYYTGITRLAKNILQEVVDRVNSLEPAYLFTHRSLKTLARDAREAISLRDLPAIARVIRASWNANKLIHASTTNDEVEKLLARVDGLYTAMKLLGAGGGGYVLFVSDTIRQAEQLRERVSAIEHERARIVDMSLNTAGLQISVS